MVVALNRLTSHLHDNENLALGRENRAKGVDSPSFISTPLSSLCLSRHHFLSVYLYNPLSISTPLSSICSSRRHFLSVNLYIPLSISTPLGSICSSRHYFPSVHLFAPFVYLHTILVHPDTTFFICTSFSGFFTFSSRPSALQDKSCNFWFCGTNCISITCHADMTQSTFLTVHSPH